MIDIHAHILPQLDDGPVSWDESLRLLRRGVEDGVRGVVCTSHVLDRLDEKVEREFIRKFNELKRIVKREGLPVHLWLGSEIQCYVPIDPRFKIATLNGNGKYLLLELPMGEFPHNIEDLLFRLSLDGLTPILAHPERNAIVLRKPRVVYEFVRRGVLIQLNAGSITGLFGKRVKRVAFEMLDHRLVHFVASDCHRPRSRPLALSKAYEVVSRRRGRDTAELLFRENPAKAVKGEPISTSQAVPFDEGSRRRKKLFGMKIFRG